MLPVWCVFSRFVFCFKYIVISVPKIGFLVMVLLSLGDYFFFYLSKGKRKISSP